LKYNPCIGSKVTLGLLEPPPPRLFGSTPTYPVPFDCIKFPLPIVEGDTPIPPFAAGKIVVPTPEAAT
jgi:hypothetical protein